MFSMMLFIFLCFFGILAVLFFLLRQTEKQFDTLREENAQLRVMLRVLEARLDGKESGYLEDSDNTPAADPLLHLSFAGSAEAVPAQTQENVDPALELHFDSPVTENTGK